MVYTIEQKYGIIMKQRSLLSGELEVLGDLKAVANIAAVVGGIRYAHLAYTEGSVRNIIICALHFLITGFMYSIIFDIVAHSTELDILGNFSEFANHNDYGF